MPGILYKDSTPVATKEKAETSTDEQQQQTQPGTSKKEPKETATTKEDASKKEDVPTNTAPIGTNVDIDDEMAQIEKEIEELENQVDDSTPGLEEESTIEIDLIVDEKEAEDEINLIGNKNELLFFLFKKHSNFKDF